LLIVELVGSSGVTKVSDDLQNKNLCMLVVRSELIVINLVGSSGVTEVSDDLQNNNLCMLVVRSRVISHS
jgi:hypothetical protein